MSSRNGEPRQPAQAAQEKKARWSLARRLTVWNLCWLVGIGSGATAFYHLSLTREFAKLDDEFLSERIHVLSGLLGQGKTARLQLGREIDSEPEEVLSGRVYMRVLNAKGELFVETPGMAQLLPAKAFPVAQGPEGQERILVRGPSGRVFGVMAATVAGARVDEEWVVQAAYDRTSLEAALWRHERTMAIALAIACLAVVGLSYCIIRRGLQPIREIVDATQRIRSSTLGRRIHVQQPAPELAQLADNFNEMLDRLDKSFQHVSKFSGDIAHELRTPLTNLRCAAEVAISKDRTAEQYREVLVSSLEDYTYISGIIDRLLFLALAERSEGCLERKLVNFSEELASIAAFYEPTATELNLGLQLAANGDLCMNADPVLVRRAVSNLVSNAIANTPPGGTVALAAYRQESVIRVLVVDNGTGIPPEHLPHVFNRFYRVNRTPRGRWGGAGLGLSIVQTIMDLHDGLVQISSDPGHGTSVTLEFPLVTKS